MPSRPAPCWRRLRRSSENSKHVLQHAADHGSDPLVGRHCRFGPMQGHHFRIIAGRFRATRPIQRLPSLAMSQGLVFSRRCGMSSSPAVRAHRTADRHRRLAIRLSVLSLWAVVLPKIGVRRNDRAMDHHLRKPATTCGTAASKPAQPRESGSSSGTTEPALAVAASTTAFAAGLTVSRYRLSA